MSSRYTRDGEYQKRREVLKRRCRRDGTPCWLCGKPFDWTVDQERDPMSFTADHVVPIAKGGRMTGELKPAHRSCNSRRGDGSNAPRPPLAPVVTTLDWI